MSCIRCTYSLRGLDARGRCPECGLPVGESLGRFTIPVWLLVSTWLLLVFLCVGNTIWISPRHLTGGDDVYISGPGAIICAVAWFIIASVSALLFVFATTLRARRRVKCLFLVAVSLGLVGIVYNALAWLHDLFTTMF